MKERLGSCSLSARAEIHRVSSRAVGAMKKGVSGKPKVFESKKEKLRRLLLRSDSESGDDLVSTCQKVDVGSDQNAAAGAIDLKERELIQKRMLRVRIKNILLSGGWTIDYIRQRSQPYKDSVYISPGGTVYWSIVNAYDAFQKQLKYSQFQNTFIPMGELSILRSSKGKIKREMAHNYIEQRSKTTKEPTKMKPVKNKHQPPERGRLNSNNTQEGKSLKGKIKENGFGALNMKGLVGNLKSNHHLGKVDRGNKKALLSKLGNSTTTTLKGTPRNSVLSWSVLSWLIDSGTVAVNGRVKYMSKRHTKSLLDGWITRDGIRCSCCSKIFTISKFEIHAGSKLSQPLQYILVEETGVSLMHCLLDAWDKQEDSKPCGYVDIDGDDQNDDTCCICGDGGHLICCSGCPSTFHQSCLDIQMEEKNKARGKGESNSISESIQSSKPKHMGRCCRYVDIDGDDPNDDTCGICGDGGNLICCDGCPSAFHQRCLGVQMIPPGDWHCPNCSCKFCGVASGSATKGDNLYVSPLLSCRQCEKKYHKDCLWETDVILADSNTLYTSFCGKHCREVWQGKSPALSGQILSEDD